MHFSPRNRHLYIEVLNQEEGDKSQILLPEDYRPTKEGYVAARLVDWAPDCNGAYLEEDIVVVRQNMIEEIKVGIEAFHVVLENHVIGIWENEDYSGSDIN